MKRLRSLFVCMVSIGFVGTTALACDSSAEEDGCGMSLCGCSTEVTMAFTSTVQDASTMMNLSGIELLCFAETTPIAVSDAAGVLSFSIQTLYSPACKYARCTNMTLHDPTGAHPDLVSTYFAFNQKTVAM